MEKSPKESEGGGPVANDYGYRRPRLEADAETLQPHSDGGEEDGFRIDCNRPQSDGSAGAEGLSSDTACAGM